MQLTSKEANKLIAKLQMELSQIESHEAKVYKFTVATSEDKEAVRPAYNLEETKKQKENLQEQIRRIKHALNVFNTQTKVEGFGFTVDEMLVYIPQLQALYSRFSKLASQEQQERLGVNYNSIEYSYANYDVEEAKKFLDETREEIAKAQAALDKTNLTIPFEVQG